MILSVFYLNDVPFSAFDLNRPAFKGAWLHGPKQTFLVTDVHIGCSGVHHVFLEVIEL